MKHRDLGLFSLKVASPDDLEDIMHVEHESFLPSVVEDKVVFLERIEVFPSGFLLFQYEENTIGYFCSELWNDCSYPYPTTDFTLGHSANKLFCKGGPTLYIASMGILPSFRGNGIGTYLFNQSLAAVTACTPSIRKHVLLVNETWSAARAVYKKNGFAEVQTLKGFFSLSEKEYQDALIMERLVIQ